LATATATAPTVDLITFSQSETGPRAYSATVSFPTLSGPSPGIAKANALLASQATQMAGSFIAEAKKALVPKGLPPQTSSLTDQVQAQFVSGRLVSFITFYTYYWAGAAHPFTNVATGTVSVTTGARVGLGSLFKPGANWLAAVAKESRNYLLAEFRGLGMGPFITQATKPVAANFQGWSLTPFGLQMSFSQGVAGPEAAGVESVMLPFAGFAGIARPGGPMAAAAALSPVRMPLLPATVPPRVNECFKASNGRDYQPAAATCPGGDLNVAAWDQWDYARPVLTLGAKPSEARLKAALCPFRLYGPGPLTTLAQLGISYYGWPYSAVELSKLPKTCPRG